jgi:mRNA-degrading endonuclease RelE of RelBE toxin-antitoxin system
MKRKTRRPRGNSTETPQWELGYLEKAATEARKFLSEEQIAHVVELFDQLAYEPDPARSERVDVRKIEDFYEVRDKGGVLGKINVRVYFTVLGKHRVILALHVYKKEDEGKPPRHVMTTVRRRLRKVMQQYG